VPLEAWEWVVVGAMGWLQIGLRKAGVFVLGVVLRNPGDSELYCRHHPNGANVPDLQDVDTISFHCSGLGRMDLADRFQKAS